MIASRALGRSERARLIGRVLIAGMLVGAGCSSGGNSHSAGGLGGQTTQGSGGTGPGVSGSGGNGAGTGTGLGGTGIGGGTGGAIGSSADGGGTSPGTGGGTAGGAGTGAGGAPTTGTGGTAGGGGVPAACAAPIPVTGTAATVSVDLGVTALAKVSPDLLGVHTAVYDGLLTTDAMTPGMLKAAGVTSLRYPGGSYADVYHWESHTAHATPAQGQGSNFIYIAPGADFGSFVTLLQQASANALITVNYGMNSSATGPAVPQQAAAWVAYANGSPSNTMALGVDANGVDWKTVGYWAGLRASAPLAVDTVPPTNLLRINRPAPAGIKYWEIGNEIYGNGYYNGTATSAGWEPDLHAPYNGANGTARRGNVALSPATYGMGVKTFAAAMKAVDPTIQIGGQVNWPDTAYTTPTAWNSSVLGQACASMDFAVAHWYPGSTIVSLLTVARTQFPGVYTGLRGLLTADCPQGKGANMPIAITEWGPNINQANDITAQLTNRFNAGLPPTNTQIVGLFAAESYATFMEQGVLSAHWAQMHIPGGGYLEPTAADNWGYHGALMAHYFAGPGDSVLPPPVASNASIFAHASQHADGTVAVMLTNTSATVPLAVTVNVTGGASPLHCSGFRYGYTSAGMNLDGPVTTQDIFAAATGTSFTVGVPAYSVVVVAFPKM